jgi:hypothetical protein
VKGKLQFLVEKKKSKQKRKGLGGSLGGGGRGRCILAKLVKGKKTKENLV